jgi:DNA-binding MarR family transcriptional regulator
MDMNLFEQAGGLAIATRLQRLAEHLRREGVLIYRAHGISFEPKWFPVVYALHQRAPLSILELSEIVGYAHPSTIGLLKELEKEGLVESFKDEKDTRKRMIRLSAKAEILVQQMQPVWEKIRLVTEEITNTANNLLTAMEETEYQLKKEGMFDRYLRLSTEEVNSGVRVVNYEPKYAGAFYDLNYAWISETYEVEPEDEKTLSDPEQYYLRDGGAILIALYNDEPVGTCALKKSGEGVFELSKMTVSTALRGKKMGELLGYAAIARARELGAVTMILYSNKVGSSAGINLYRKLGFVEVPLGSTSFNRADIKMALVL